MAHEHWMPDNKGYKHTLRICNTYYFSTATIVTRTPLNVTLYVHCLSCIKCRCPLKVMEILGLCQELVVSRRLLTRRLGLEPRTCDIKRGIARGIAARILKLHCTSPTIRRYHWILYSSVSRRTSLNVPRKIAKQIHKYSQIPQKKILTSLEIPRECLPGSWQYWSNLHVRYQLPLCFRRLGFPGYETLF